MSTRVDQLSEILGSLDQPRDAGAVRDRGIETGFEFWRGASGTTYVHSIYPLLTCPELPQANVLFVHRSDDGTKDVRHIGQTTDTCPSLNRAAVRQRATELGANEIHVHFLGATSRERSIITFDLAAFASDDLERGLAN